MPTILPRLFAILSLFASVVAGLPPAPQAAAPSPAAPAAALYDLPADPAIRAVWQRADEPVAAGTAQRSWLWGPGPFFTTYEPADGTPAGVHLVQYFDKGRLEINDPGADRNSPWFVTSGLLVKEMMLGIISTGSAPGDEEARPPATMPVSGEDVGADSAPGYAAFAGQTAPQPAAVGRPVTATIDRAGQVTDLPEPPAPVQIAAYDAPGGHNIADVFWTYMHLSGPVLVNGRLRQDTLFDWVYVLGRPLTEPLWVQASIQGTRRWVLVQLFERRVLTYTPTNPPGWQVEQANVGRHYQTWRYANLYSDVKDVNSRTHYTVTAQVDSARNVTVHEQISYVNTTALQLPLKEVVLRTIYHHWKGAFTLTGARVGDQPVAARWRDDSNLNVPLPALLAPGAAVTFTLEFRIHPQSFGGRHGYDHNTDLLSLGDWLPTVVPYENGSWAQFPYADVGDQGNSAVADYSVTFTTADRMVIGGTGHATVHDAHNWAYEAPGVRDVAYILSSRFMDPYADASLTRQVGDTTIRAFLLTSHRADAAGLLDLVAAALRWYGGRLSPYPYPDFLLGEMGYPTEKQWDYSQEYPEVYLIPTQHVPESLTPGTWSWITPVHEVAHQWFYGLVGSNQLQDPWLDEAVVSFMSAAYTRAVRPDVYSTVWQTITDKSADRPVSASLYDGYGQDDSAYFHATYDLGTRFIGEVYDTMGADAFWAALQDYVGQYTGRRATPTDFLAVLRAHSPVPLDPVFARYLAYR